MFAALNEIRPTNAVLVEESPSDLSDLHKAQPIIEPDTFYTFASGGLGWNLPASVGVALAERDSGRNRPVITVIGDGSFQYSVQSIWSAAQLHLPMLILVLRNEEYCILKSFAVHEEALVFPASIFLGSTSSRWPEAMGAMRRASTILARSRKPPPKPG